MQRYEVDTVKKVLTLGEQGYITIQLLEHSLKMSKAKLHLLLKELISEGFIEKLYGQDIWVNTVKGKLFEYEGYARKISRQKAESQIDLLLQRIKEVKQNEIFLWKVEEAWTIREYLDNITIELSKLEIVVHLARKEKDEAKYRTLANKKRETERGFRNMLEELGFPVKEVMLFLKSKSHHLVIHDRASLRYFDKMQKVMIYPFN